jgi:hypothetical protein
MLSRIDNFRSCECICQSVRVKTFFHSYHTESGKPHIHIQRSYSSLTCSFTKSSEYKDYKAKVQRPFDNSPLRYLETKTRSATWVDHCSGVQLGVVGCSPPKKQGDDGINLFCLLTYQYLSNVKNS